MSVADLLRYLQTRYFDTVWMMCVTCVPSFSAGLVQKSINNTGNFTMAIRIPARADENPRELVARFEEGKHRVRRLPVCSLDHPGGQLWTPNKQKRSHKRWFNAGPTLAALDQHWTNVWRFVCWDPGWAQQGRDNQHRILLVWADFTLLDSFTAEALNCQTDDYLAAVQIFSGFFTCRVVLKQWEELCKKATPVIGICHEYSAAESH